jgi:hypothetical protein
MGMIPCAVKSHMTFAAGLRSASTTSNGHSEQARKVLALRGPSSWDIDGEPLKANLQSVVVWPAQSVTSVRWPASS